MSNPRYLPRSFVLPPRDFGRRQRAEWRKPDSTWSQKEVAQLDAAQLQHQVAYGVLEEFLPTSEIRTITALAERLDMPYPRVQRMLNGQTVMQLEDIGHLRRLLGAALVDSWISNATTYT
ncbi:hypothetical protein ACIQTT_06695 [Microbacterium sp. NPDC090225]|uniref:hypothetical protein n=1 Tax=Microbacterium sp. NPDC090225 TaxID=3364207 RepID=UPI00381B2B57